MFPVKHYVILKTTNIRAKIERMSALLKLNEIATQMHLEPAEETSFAPPTLPCGVTPPKANRLKVEPHPLVSYSVMPGGKKMPMLKTMMTTVCERNCYYCPFRAGRSSMKRVTFSPDEMAKTTHDMSRAGLIQGLFLSSGIVGGGVRAQDKIIETAAILREKYKYRGYLHLKVMPGAEKAQVERLMQLANRVSVNLEAPNGRRLADLAPKKVFFEELLRPLQWMQQIRETKDGRMGWNGRWSSSTTQFVVGAVGESDLEILSTAAYLYKHLGLSRTYFSPFHPIPDTPFENLPAEDEWRKFRLYQASFLFRDYNFDLEEMPFTQDGRLPLDTDPKLAWAQANLGDDPVELNAAEREELLRVPGVGHQGTMAIIRARRYGSIRYINDLKKIGVQTKRLKPFVLLDGKRPSYQLPLLW